MQNSGSKYLLLVLSLVTWFTQQGQDVHFSQFSASPILLNAATAGSSEADYRLAINYKNQWKSVINPFKTAAIAFDTKLFKSNASPSHFGLGVSLLNDKVGAIKFTTNQINVDLAYHLQLNSKNRLSAGIKTGLFQKFINPSGLRWDNQYNGKDYDASRPTGEVININNYNNFDLGTGLLYTSNRIENGLIWQVGAAATHLTGPNNSFYNQDVSTSLKFTGHAQVQYQPKDRKYMLLPAAIFVQQGGHREIVAGTNIALALGESFNNSAIHFGTFYRYRDALIFVAALQYSKNMKFGLSYDINVSGFTGASKFRGGPEFSFVYTGFRKEKRKTEEQVKADSVLPAPPIVAVYRGAIYDMDDQPVKAEIKLFTIEGENQLLKYSQASKNNHADKIDDKAIYTDSISGRFRVEFKPGKKYKIQIIAKGYETAEEEFDLIALSKFTETKKDYFLVPSATEKKKEAPLSPCSGKMAPDLSSIRGKSLNQPQVYQQMLSLFDNYCAEGLNFKVQIAAFPINKQQDYKYEHLKQFGTAEIASYPDGLTRFTMGGFKTMKEADVFRLKLIKAGQKDAWIVVFINGKRLALEEYIKQFDGSPAK
jgi:type IX secretion system PorP/SprF family membrane protein